MFEFILIVVYSRCLDDLEALVLLPGRLDLMVEAGSLLNKASDLLLSVHLDLSETVVEHAKLTRNFSFFTGEVLNLISECRRENNDNSLQWISSKSLTLVFISSLV